MAKSTNRKKKAESVAETLCSFNRFLCDIVISIYMVVILAVLPLYNKGYAQIGTEKENFFLKTMTYAGKFLLPVFLLWLLVAVVAMIQKKDLLKKNMLRQLPEIVWREFGTTDKFAFAYGIAVILSYAFTNYREEALWGTASWRMGMWTQLGAVIVYFMVSRMWQWKDWISALILPVSGVVFFLGYMNKFGRCLVDQEIVISSFISTIGNINWYCGYMVTVLFGGVYLLWRMEESMTWKKLLLTAYVTIGFASLATQGSSSGIVTFVVVMFVLFGMSVKDGEKMECFWMEMTLFSGTCLVTYLLRVTNIFSREMVLEGMTDLLTFSKISIFMTIVSAGIWWLLHGMNRKKRYPEKIISYIYRGLCIAIPVMIAAILLFTLVNTLMDGKLTPEMTAKAAEQTGGEYYHKLMFGPKWGSARGATWTAGVRCFWEMDFLHKIFGVGPDCMYAFLSNEGSENLQEMVTGCFYGSRLTNAHNEWLTILVNVGVLGFVAYAGMMISAIRNFFRAGKTSAIVGACGFCVLAYTVNNMFSFQQVMNISTVFVVMGIGENRLRSVCSIRQRS